MKSKKKGKRYIMYCAIILASLIGVTNIMDRSEVKVADGGETNGLKTVVRWVASVPGRLKNMFDPGEDGENSTNNAPLKAANQQKAREILVSVCNAAEIFSIRAGGGGDSLFPTNAFQMRDNMPPIVAKSVVGCFGTEGVPFGGYVCQYQSDPTRTNYLSRAIPANGYTGAVFIVRKDMEITQVEDTYCASTNTDHQTSK